MKHRGVRVIAGSARGRRLAVPEHGVRPTKDMVREAVFSALHARHAIVDASVLDLYAGTGAYGIESISRGAARAVLVERERNAASIVTENVATVGFADRARVLRDDAARFVAGPRPREAPFDLVFADPPYDAAADDIAAVLTGLTTADLLSADAYVVLERPERTPSDPPAGFEVGWERAFGDTLVFFLQTT